MKKRSIVPLVFALGLSALLIVRDVAGVGFSKYILFAYVVAVMVPVAYETAVYMTCFILPLVCGLPGTYVMPCILVLLVLKRGGVNLRQLLFIALIAVMELVAALWYPRQNLALIVQYVSFAGVMLFLIHDKRELDYLRCVRLYLFGVVLLCGVIITVGLQTAPKNWMDLFAKGWFRFGETQREETEGMSLILNANSMAYYSITGIACGILCAEKSKGWRRFIYIIVVVFLLAAGFLTVSRSWLLIAAGCLALYFLSKLRSWKQLVPVVLVGGALVVIGILWLNDNPYLLQAFETRMEDDTVSTGGSRTVIFEQYMEYWVSDLRVFWLGVGVSQGNAVVNQSWDVLGAMHNGLQQILVYCGLVGFVVYMAALGIPVFGALKGKKQKLINWLPLIGWVVFVQVIQFLNPCMLMLPYVICIYALRAGESTGSETK